MDISILVLNEDFLATYAISEFNSFIWTERYWAAGDFELQTIYTQDIFDNIKIGNYIYINGSETLMVVESIQIAYDPANPGNQTLTYKGRSINSMVDRRIIWGSWSIRDSQPIQASFFNLLSANVVYPSDKDRKMDIFTLGLNVTDPALDKVKINASGYADNLYEVIQAACESEGVGFRAVYVDGASTCTLQFYVGKDRSYSQDKLPPVIFSKSFENLGNSRYGIDTEPYKTLAYAYGPEEELEIEHEDEETGEVTTEVIRDRTVMVVGTRRLTGLDRREMAVSATSSYPEDIQQEAMEKLAKLNTLDVLDAELDWKRQFVYGKDFFMGDIVQIVTEFGLDARARVTEFIRSWSPTGYTEVPTFKVMDDYESRSVETVHISRSVEEETSNGS